MSYSPIPATKGAPLGKLSVLPASYPTIRRDSTVDILHGVSVQDPYRWLEDPDADETKAFVEAQNNLTSSVLTQCPARESFKDLFSTLYNYERYGVPVKKGSRYYYSHNTGLQAQNVLYTVGSVDENSTEEPRVFIDPNTLSEDGTIALMSYSFSESGCLCAMTFSSGGTDWRTVEVSKIDQATGERIPLVDERLENVKFTSIAWTHDEKGFFYNWYEPPVTTEAGTETTANKHQQLKYHVLGRPQSEDVTVLGIPEEPDWMIGAEISTDGRFLILSISAGCEPTNRLWTVDLETIPKSPPAAAAAAADDDNDGDGGAYDFSSFDFHKGSQPLPLIKLIDNFDASWDYIGAAEGNPAEWMLQTNYKAPRYRLVRTSNVLETSSGDSSPDKWKEVIPEHEKDVLQWACKLKGDALITCYLQDVKSTLQLRSFARGAVRQDLPLPGVGSVGGFSGSHKSSEFFFSFVGFTEPGAQYRCDLETSPTPTLFRRIQTKFDPDAFETKQVFVESKDGTKIPMFIVHRRGLELNSNNPTLLYGYGGFSISLTPSFSVSRVAWLLAFDGVYCVANLRGGGEYGREWRDAGSLLNKQNVFDDFQAAAAWLHTNKYCSPSTLAIQGGSNGGLLVAACANQAPHLYAAVLAQVGVMDMLRFHQFTIGHAWMSDYGDPSKEEDFTNLVRYSPVHNVAQPTGGTKQYPAMLLTTGSHDDRVVPLHTHKLLATLQHVLAGSEDSVQRTPLLARYEVRAGHGAGKPTQKIIEETADMLAFAAAAMGAEFKYEGQKQVADNGNQEEDVGAAAAANGSV